MNLVYIISAYKLPEQLIRLVHRLQAPKTTFLIHIDRKTSPEIASGMKSGLEAIENVQFLPSHNCFWGEFGHVAASLEGIRAIGEQAVPCDYAVLLTGQDYPIKTHAEITAKLETGGGKSFLSHFPLPSRIWPNQGMERIERWHCRIMGRYLPFPRNENDRHVPWLPRFVERLLLPDKRRFYPGMKPFGGGGYWCLSHEAVEYVYAYVRVNPRYVRFFKTVYIPDELFFQTILMNSPLHLKLIDDDLRQIDWSDRRPGRFPAIFEVKDIDMLMTSQKLFARKFDTTIDGEILELIDTRILGVTAPT